MAITQRLIYDIPSSPYRKLLLWAGCDWADLCANVKTRGLKKTLEQLRDAGMYLTLEEFKSRIPVSRRGLTFETGESDFDNPFLGSHRLEGATSGSRGRSTRVAYDWEFIAKESAHELLLYTMHGVLNAPTALWFPVPPGIAGIHNLLMNLKLGRIPKKLRGVVAQGERLPFGDATLDGVVATSVMGCVPETRCVYAEMYRVLRPHGCAVLTFTNRASWLLKLNYVAARSSGAKFRLYDAACVTRELEGFGFQVLQTQFYNFVLRAGGVLLPPPSLARRLDGLGRHRFSRHWARNFIVVAQKRSAVR